MKCLIKWTIYGGIVCIFLMYSPTLLDFTPKIMNVPWPSFSDALKDTTIVSNEEHLYEDLVHGPESIVFYKGDLYSGMRDGTIVRVRGGKVTTMARTGRACVLPYEEKLCGRPLGIREKDGLLYVIDAYYGIFIMNFTTGAMTKTLSSDVEVDGRSMKLLDDLDIDDEGNIYFSDSSKKWDLAMAAYLMMEYEGEGRILKHNIHSGETVALVNNLHFPNGVQLSNDKKSVLINEISNRRILRHHLKGPKKGQTEVFADNLPAEPDNIRSSSRGYWVAFPIARNASNPLGIDRLISSPIVRRIFARTQHAVGAGLMAIAEIASSHQLKSFAYQVKTATFYISLITKHGVIAEFNEKGEIIRRLRTTESSGFTEVREHEGHLYLGSFFNNFVTRLKLE